MKNDKIVLYMHSGSGNHGCEAIIRGTANILNIPLQVLTCNKKEDQDYLSKDGVEILAEKDIDANPFVHAILYMIYKIKKSKEIYVKYRLKPILGKHIHDINISVGGDNYCYADMIPSLQSAHRILLKEGVKTILWGCSIEPDLLQDKVMLEDLSQYDLITARESITYDALLQAELHNVQLYPDPAFQMETTVQALPEAFTKKPIVGINVSPMIIANEQESGVTYENYKALMQYIIDETDMNILLVPHVVKKNNDDREPLKQLQKEFSNTDRIILLEDASADVLKGYISQCRFFVGARTHATIAAYSNCVPTLVVGYSVKARGIAKDLFGTDEHYVIPVQSLKKAQQLTSAFKCMEAEEDGIRHRLEEYMPEYIKQAGKAGNAIKSIMVETK